MQTMIGSLGTKEFVGDGDVLPGHFNDLKAFAFCNVRITVQGRVGRGIMAYWFKDISSKTVEITLRQLHNGELIPWREHASLRRHERLV